MTFVADYKVQTLDFNKLIISEIPITIAKKIIEVFHYSKKMPHNVSYCFGLIYDSKVIGCCLFGKGCNYQTNQIGDYKCLELNRLVILGKDRYNLGSYFVSQCLKKLPKPLIIISYADTKQRHLGYVYQASNWLYTGISEPEEEYIKDGTKFHRKSLYDTFKTSSKSFLLKKGFKPIIGGAKHRYIYLLGTKKQKKEMLELIKKRFGLFPYPKKTIKK